MSNAVVQSVPAAKGLKLSKPPSPKIGFRPDGSCVVTHYEYVADVFAVASIHDPVSRYRINPQSNTTFTWLSAIATRFELYKFNKCVIHYKPSCGTATNGYVIMGVDFDSYDAPPTKVELLAWKMSAKSAAWQDCKLDISKESRLTTFRFCDASTRAGDIRLDDLGTLNVRGVAPDYSASQPLGELFIEYTVEFRQPAYKIPPALYADLGDHDMASNTNWLGTAQSFADKLKANGANLALKWVAENQFQILDTGNFLISTLVGGSSSVGNITSPTVTPAAPGAEFVANSTASFTTGQAANLITLLSVLVAPVLVTYTTQAGNGMVNRIRISTFKSSS